MAARTSQSSKWRKMIGARRFLARYPQKPRGYRGRAYRFLLGRTLGGSWILHQGSGIRDQGSWILHSRFYIISAQIDYAITSYRGLRHDRPRGPMKHKVLIHGSTTALYYHFTASRITPTATYLGRRWRQYLDIIAGVEPGAVFRPREPASKLLVCYVASPNPSCRQPWPLSERPAIL